MSFFLNISLVKYQLNNCHCRCVKSCYILTNMSNMSTKYQTDELANSVFFAAEMVTVAIS